MEMWEQTLYELEQAPDDPEMARKHFSLVSNEKKQEFTPNHIINMACTRTLYPSLCFNTLSSIQIPKNSATFGHILEFTINETEKSVATARKHVTGLLGFQDLISQEKIALKDCLEMLDQTRYELEQAPDDLHAFYASNLKTLLSAAMTDQHTCIDGFSDFKNQKDLKSKIQDLFTPITGMIGNCLPIITYMESVTDEDIKTVQERKKLVKWFPRSRFYPRMGSNIRPNIVVARDGSGNCSLIGEAIKMAPNGSRHRFVIKIKAGVYNETENVPREKTNIMLIGDGMSKTIITGSKNFVDGFSTFDSATLTVAGDRFLARDLTIINTSGPYKFQAVAARVTSNSAFYRCNFSSYQDTLFAHSLRQFYRECTIQGMIVVALDGSGNCSLIGEAIEMAPNGSRHRFVIKAGVYDETVNVPREKTNIMLIGDGMSRTVITGSKKFLDGFSTFVSATLTAAGDRFLARDLTNMDTCNYISYQDTLFAHIMLIGDGMSRTVITGSKSFVDGFPTFDSATLMAGDRFLARDLAIINTSGPNKYQAVAARVTSNSAFYRCNFNSYQYTPNGSSVIKIKAVLMLIGDVISRTIIDSATLRATQCSVNDPPIDLNDFWEWALIDIQPELEQDAPIQPENNQANDENGDGYGSDSDLSDAPSSGSLVEVLVETAAFTDEAYELVASFRVMDFANLTEINQFVEGRVNAYTDVKGLPPIETVEYVDNADHELVMETLTLEEIASRLKWVWVELIGG
ncbi:pectinesterase 3-like isoform X2 [Mercurialis annua]|uniref:pectinesterase 3-like isoform X2 n=1 Tax=Mercurialis annua TaxID=3986 RepID=UPI002160C8D8|nr:pectinesterase 3-like isoform X2 [Mercurialis annua]